jgi:salicylate hydroxylase
MIDSSRLAPETMPPAVTTWAGRDQHLVHYHVRRDALVSVAGVARTSDAAAEPHAVAGDAAELQRTFAGWHPAVRQLLAQLDRCEKWPLYQRDLPSQWSVGRVALLGDACHPMLPFLEQGAAMAIEDAWILARLLEDAEDAPLQGLADYQQYRAPRVQRLTRQTGSYGEELHLAPGWKRMKRNTRLGFASRLLPELATSHLEWLYGYDAVKGFD